MDSAEKRVGGTGGAVAASEERKKSRERPGHGSTAVFVAVDYAFLLAFAGFLSYLLVSHLLPSVAAD